MAALSQSGPAGARVSSTSAAARPARHRVWLRCAAALALIALATPALAAGAADGPPALAVPVLAAAVTPGPARDGTFGLPDPRNSLSPDDESSSIGSTDSDGESSSARDSTAKGNIGIVGTFNGVSSFSPNSPGGALALDSNRTSVVALSQTAASLLTAASSEGQVTAACALYTKSGELSKAYFGGTVSKLNNTIVGYVFGLGADGRFDAMASGVNGPVNALYCDGETGLVYVGGNFSSTAAGLTGSVSTMRSSSTGGLAVYAPAKGAWQTLPFHGVDGPVFDFAKLDDSIYAVGAFSQTVDNSTHTALNAQPIDLSASTLTGGNSAEILGFSDPHNIICTTGADSAGNTWLMRDKLPGYYRIDFPFRTVPSLLRLMNTGYQGRGTKAIRVEAAATNQALTLSYIDPITQTETLCTQSCPLRADYSWQEFRIVEVNGAPLDGITGIIVNIVDWYGMGGGFNKIELYHKDAQIYAIDGYNGSPCSAQAVRPMAQPTGDWRQTSPASYHGSYLTLTVNRDEVNSTAAQNAVVALVPYVPESGFYTVYMTIPGCQNTNTCAQRTSANVTWLMNSKQSIVTAVAQHNVADQEVELFTGYAPASSMNFSSAIYISLSPNGTADPQTSTVEVVVASFRLQRVTSYTNLGGVLEIHDDLSSPLQIDGPLYKPLKRGLPHGSVVYAAAAAPGKTEDATLFLGGQFADARAGYHNVVQYRNQTLAALGNTGLSGPARSMAFVDSSLFVGGSFNGTADHDVALGNVAAFNTTDRRWHPLAGGTAGPVTTVVPYSPFGRHTVAFAGDFGALYMGDHDKPTRVGVEGLAMWDSLVGGWTNTPYLSGRLSLLHSSAWSDSRANVALAAGSLDAAAALKANGAVMLSPQQQLQSIDMVGYDLHRGVDGQFTVNTGLWYAKDDSGSGSTLIVGGVFQTSDSATNVARLDSGKWRRLLDDDIDGAVLTINNAANLLFIGGAANLTEDADKDASRRFSGLTVFDMDGRKEVGVQRLQGPDNSRAVRVNKVAIRKNTSMVVVGGNFSTAGGMLSCAHICTLDINENQWSPLAPSSLVDQVTDLLFVGDKLVTAGTFKNGTQPTRYLMQYNFDANIWEDVPGADRIPGPVTTLAAASNGADAPNTASDAFYAVGTALAGGTPFFAKYDGSSVVLPAFTIGAQSTIRGLLEVPRSRIPASVLGGSPSLTRRADPVVPAGLVLAVSGDLHLPGGVRASSAFFFDNQWAPFLSTIQDDGSPGTVGSVFFEIPPTSVYQLHRLSTALVILIAVAIALGITFLIVLVGLVYVYLRNRREVTATASAASAALAAAAGGAGTAKAPLSTALSGVTAGAAAGGARRYLQGNDFSAAAGAQASWGARVPGGEPVAFDNIAPSTGRLNSGTPVHLSGLTAAGRLVAPSSETYVQSTEKKAAAKYDDNESLDSIFESAAAEAEAAAESEARERAASMGSLGGLAMPAAHHHDAQGNELSDDTSRAPRPDSTNPFEQRMAQRAFPPAGPFGEGDGGVGYIPMPSPQHELQRRNEQSTAAVLAGAAGAAASAAARDNRGRSESASTQNSEGEFGSQSASSRPSGESSSGRSAAHLPVRDSLKQYPVYYAKFTFSSRETGELGFRAGERVFVIDQSDEIWWMGIVDHGADQPLEQGVFPATYVNNEPPPSTDWSELL